MLILRLLTVIIVFGVVQCTISNPQFLSQTLLSIRNSLQELLNNRKKLAGARLLFPANALFASHIKIEFFTGVLTGHKDPLFAAFHKAHTIIREEVARINEESVNMILTKNALIQLVLDQPLAYKDRDLIDRISTPTVSYFPDEVLEYVTLFFTTKLSLKQMASVEKLVKGIFASKNPDYSSFLVKIMMLRLTASQKLAIFLKNYKRFLSLLEYIFNDKVLSIPPDNSKGITVKELWSLFGFQFEDLVDQMRPLDKDPINTRTALLAAQAGALYLLMDGKVEDSGDNLKVVVETFIRKLLPGKSFIVSHLLFESALSS